MRARTRGPRHAPARRVAGARSARLRGRGRLL